MKPISRWALPAAVVLAAGLVATIDTGTAAAQVRAAIVPFEGAGAAGARRQVQRQLEDDGRVSVVELNRVDSAADRTGASSRSSSGASDLARELDARLIVQGRVSGRGRRRRVELTALDENGREVASASGQLRGQGVARAVRTLLDQSMPRLPSPRQEVAEPPPPAITTPAAATPPEEPEDEAPDESGEDRGWERRAPLLEVQVGVVPRSREADVTFRDTRHGRYTAWYPELAVRAAVRPFNADPGVIQGIYGRALFAHAVGLESQIDSTGEVVESSFYRFDFALGWLFPLLSELDLGIELGAGWENYGLSENVLLESVEYVYLRPAIAARMRIFREYLVLGADVGFRPVLSRGGFDAYGTGGDTFGFDVGGSIGGGFALAGTFGLSWAIEVSYVNYWSSFEDPPDPAFAGDSGTDGGVRIGIFAGIALW